MGSRRFQQLGAALAVALLAASAADTWTHRQGPVRNGTVPWSSGYGELTWPPGAPTWTAKVGVGSSSPIVAPPAPGETAPRLYTMGWEDGHETLHAFDAHSGEPKWTGKYAAPAYGRFAMGDQGLFEGPISTPEYDRTTRRVFTLGCDGDLMAWSESGDSLWHRNLYDQLKVGQRPKLTRQGHRDYGYTSSPVAAGPWVIVEAGSPEHGNTIAFRKSDGEFAWASQCKDEAGHNNGPAPFLVDRVPCLAVFTHRNLVVMRLDPGHEGETVGQVPWLTDYAQHIATPAVAPNRVIVTAGYNQMRMTCYKVSLADGLDVQWEQSQISKICTPVIHRGHVYFAYRNLVCLDAASGEERWRGGDFGEAGSVVATGDNRLVAYGGKGRLVLAEGAARSPNAYKELAAAGPYFRTDAWPHAVFVNERLYLKDRAGNLACHALRGAGGGIDAPAGASADSPPAVLSLRDEVDNGLVFGWQRQGEADVFTQPRGTKPWRMDADDEAWKVRGAGPDLVRALRSSNEFTIEMLFRPAGDEGSGRLLNLARDDTDRMLTIGQVRDRLGLRIRTSNTEDAGATANLGNLQAGAWHWVSVTYSPGRLRCYINGQRTADSPAVQGDLFPWGKSNLQLKEGFAGDLFHLAIFNRAMEADEMIDRYRQTQGRP